MKRLKTFVYAVLAGMCIAIGGAVFLSIENKILGALFFTCGLFTICTNGFNLFTGKVCYVFDNNLSYAIDLPIIWLGNLLGTWIFAKMLLLTRVGEAMRTRAVGIVNTKIADSPLSLFLLAIMCDIMIFIAVDGYKNNPHEFGKYLALFFGVMIFIICGFEHCVANMFYISVANMWDAQTAVAIIIMTLGNAVGGVIIPLLRKWKEK